MMHIMCAYEFKISFSRLFSIWPSLMDSSLLLMYANFNLVANAITEPAVSSTHDSVIVFFPLVLSDRRLE